MVVPVDTTVTTARGIARTITMALRTGTTIIVAIVTRQRITTVPGLILTMVPRITAAQVAR